METQVKPQITPIEAMEFMSKLNIPGKVQLFYLALRFGLSKEIPGKEYMVAKPSYEELTKYLNISRMSHFTIPKELSSNGLVYLQHCQHKKIAFFIPIYSMKINGNDIRHFLKENPSLSENLSFKY